MTQWAHKILDSKGNLILLQTVFPDRGPAFYYMLVSNENRANLFEEIKKPQNVNLELYGKVVHSGWGEPNEGDKEYMRKNHKADI